jgi:hypothetical protein
MTSIKEKALNMMAAIFDVMEVDSASFDAASNGSAEELVLEDDTTGDGHNKLIELCW